MQRSSTGGVNALAFAPRSIMLPTTTPSSTGATAAAAVAEDGCVDATATISHGSFRNDDDVNKDQHEWKISETSPCSDEDAVGDCSVTEALTDTEGWHESENTIVTTEAAPVAASRNHTNESISSTTLHRRRCRRSLSPVMPLHDLVDRISRMSSAHHDDAHSTLALELLYRHDHDDIADIMQRMSQRHDGNNPWAMMGRAAETTETSPDDAAAAVSNMNQFGGSLSSLFATLGVQTDEDFVEFTCSESGDDGMLDDDTVRAEACDLCLEEGITINSRSDDDDHRDGAGRTTNEHHMNDIDAFSLHADTVSCSSSVTWYEGSNIVEIEVDDDDLVGIWPTNDDGSGITGDFS